MSVAWFQPLLQRHYRQLLACICYMVLYLVFDKMATTFAIESLISLWYPSAALSMLLIIGVGPVGIPALLIANLLSLLWNYHLPLNLATLTLISIHVTAYTGAGFAFRRLLPKQQIDNIQAISRFLIIGFLPAILVAALSCMLLVVDGLLSWPEYPRAVLEWWLGDQIGISVVVPLLLTHIFPRLQGWGQPIKPVPPASAPEWLEVIAQGASLIGTLLIVFVSPLAEQKPLYLCFLPLIWIVLRFGFSGATIAITSLSFGAMIAAAQGMIPLTSLVELQLFMLAIALTGLLLGASVSEQRHTVRAFKASESHARAVIQDLTELICRYRPDTTRTLVNEAYCQFFGQTADQLVGKSFLPLTRPEYHPIIHQQIAMLIATYEPLVDESLIYRHDGTLRWMQWVNRVIIDPEKQTIEIQVVGRDITKRKEAEIARQQAEDRYRIISQMTSDYGYVYTITADGVLRRDWLAGAFTRITGYELDEFDRNGGLEAIVHPADLPDMIAKQKLLWQGVSYEIELRIVHKDGSLRWLQNTVRPEMDPETGQLVRVYGAAQDISERKQAEETRRAIDRQIQETQKLESIGLLAGGIAHDFNNVLVGVLGNAGIALTELPDDSPARLSVQQIEIAAHHAADLTRQLLAYAGKGQVMIQRIHINTLIEEMLQLLHVGIPRQVELVSRLGANVPDIEGDATQLRQVLMNIVINAAEAISPEHGTITITTDVRWVDHESLTDAYLGSELPEQYYVVIQVTDTGCGMDEATCARIFEPFFTTKFIGRGLGLAAVLGIVRSHQGTINISSIVNQGSTFTILLPSAVTPSLKPAIMLESYHQATFPAVD